MVDTPGFFHTELSPEELIAEVGRSVCLSSPGPHAFLVTLQPGRFTQEERDTFELIKAMFGPEALKLTVVLFTWGDRLQGKSMEDFLEENHDLSETVRSCHGGYHLFDNSDRDKATECSQQVVELLKKIDKMVGDNGGGCYSDEKFKEAERAIRKVQERILGKREDKSLQGEPRDKEKEMERRMEEEARKKAERLFWSELVVAMGRGAVEGAGILEKEQKVVKKTKVVERVAALAASPLSICSAARVVEGAVREGGKVLYKHRKTFLH